LRLRGVIQKQHENSKDYEMQPERNKPEQDKQTGRFLPGNNAVASRRAVAIGSARISSMRSMKNGKPMVALH
jgi:hypothetical protein